MTNDDMQHLLHAAPSCLIHSDHACTRRGLLTLQRHHRVSGNGSLADGAGAAAILAPLAALAADAAGPLPDYHPACLRAALLLGRPGVVAAALRALLRALSDATEASVDSQQVTTHVRTANT